MAAIGPLCECTLYLPGHQVHCIQGPHSQSEPRCPLTGRIASIRAGTIQVELETGVRRYRNHLASRLLAAVAAHGPSVIVDEGWSILMVCDPGDGGRSCFSIAPAGEPRRRCLTDQLTRCDEDSLVERVLSQGGFGVPATLVAANLAAAPRDPAREPPTAAAGEGTN